MKNMQPVASQDRPKLIAVSLGITLALGFVVRNIVGTGILADSGGAQQVSMSAPVVNAAPPTPADASAAIPGWSAATGAPEKPAAFGDVGPMPLSDPFQPVAPIKSTPEPAAPPPPLPAAPAVAPTVPRPAPRPPVLEADARTADRTMSAHPTAPPADTATVGPGPVHEYPNELPEAPSVPAALTGTVGSGAAAVATFRVGEETLFARPQDRVAGWRVVRIEVGQVWLSRQNCRQLVRVGNSLPGSPRLADRAAAAPAG